MEGADVDGCWQCVTNVISGWSYSSSEGPAIAAPSLVNTHDCNVLKYNAGIHKWVIGEEEQWEISPTEIPLPPGSSQCLVLVGVRAELPCVLGT